MKTNRFKKAAFRGFLFVVFLGIIFLPGFYAGRGIRDRQSKY